jgi:DNA-directed RNA polymerase specialized sigma24 family protein
MDESLRLVAESAQEEQVVAEPLNFESFFEAEARTLFRRLCAVTGNSAEAEEIMQDAFLALWERWDRVGTMQDPTGYLYRTAMNVFRKRTRRAVLALRRALSRVAEPAAFAEIDEQQDVVVALSGLTPRQRAGALADRCHGLLKRGGGTGARRDRGHGAGTGLARAGQPPTSDGRPGMNETRELLERIGGRFAFPDEAFERFARRRDRRRRNQRLAAGVLGVAITLAGVLVGASLLRSSSVPGGGSPEPTPASPLPALRRGAEVLEHACCDSGIQAVDPTTGATRLLVKEGVTEAAWSPDGTRMLYEVPCSFTDLLCDAPKSRHAGVWILDATGEPRQLVSFFGAGAYYEGSWGYPESGFAWSPDGSRIAVARPGSDPGLYIADADGSDASLIPDTEAASASRPVWSPDSSRIAYADEAGVFVVSVNGGIPALVADGGSDPAWSPDGTRLAFRSHDGIGVVGADGSGRLTVGSGYEFAWSPDGSQIAYHIERPVKGGFLEELWVVSADGSDPRPVLRSECCSGIVDGSLTWSPDGTRIAFLASEPDGDEPWVIIAAKGSDVDEEIERLPDIDVVEVLGWQPCLCTLGTLV